MILFLNVYGQLKLSTPQTDFQEKALITILHRKPQKAVHGEFKNLKSKSRLRGILDQDLKTYCNFLAHYSVMAEVESN